jgi:Txe/YoeB family toxin of Txe-Axe toxin-antitoxin module
MNMNNQTIIHSLTLTIHSHNQSLTQSPSSSHAVPAMTGCALTPIDGSTQGPWIQQSPAPPRTFRWSRRLDEPRFVYLLVSLFVSFLFCCLLLLHEGLGYCLKHWAIKGMNYWNEYKHSPILTIPSLNQSITYSVPVIIACCTSDDRACALAPIDGSTQGPWIQQSPAPPRTCRWSRRLDEPRFVYLLVSLFVSFLLCCLLLLNEGSGHWRNELLKCISKQSNTHSYVLSIPPINHSVGHTCLLPSHASSVTKEHVLRHQLTIQWSSPRLCDW